MNQRGRRGRTANITPTRDTIGTIGSFKLPYQTYGKYKISFITHLNY